MLWPAFILLVTLICAYANGANDNFKGVATLFGSGTTDYKKAIRWATVSTLAGSLVACFLAAKLIKSFSGKGLVPDSFLGNPVFLTAVVLGAGLTVLATALAGIPISTTHGLTGALVGAGLAAAGSQLGWPALAKNFIVPLLISPFLSMSLMAMIYPLFRLGSRLAGLSKTTCICIGERRIPVGNIACSPSGMIPLAELSKLDILVDEKESCEAKAIQVYQGRIFGLEVQGILDFLHFLSAGAVSFARGLNDTPKIVAIALAAGMLGLQWNILIVALVMALGGLLSARRIAETLSHKITAMSHGQGFTANLITAFLVIFASRAGLPVSTTHVSCGTLFGLGLVNGKAQWKMIGGIVLAWVLTLPTAAGLAALSFFVINRIG